MGFNNINNNKENKDLVSAAFNAMMDSTRDMMFIKAIKDGKHIYLAASLPFVKMVGKDSVEELIGKTDFEIFENQSLAQRYVMDDRKLLENGENLVDYIEPITDEDGHARYGSTSKYILRNSEGDVLGIFGVTRDITRDYVTRQHYQHELSYLFKLPEDTYAVSYIDVDSWRIISQRRQNINDCTLDACNLVSELVDAALLSIVDNNSSAAKFYNNFTPEYLYEVYNSGRSDVTFSYERRLTDGTIHWVRNDIKFLVDVDSGHLCAMLTAKNIDAKKRQEEKLVEAARLDEMTMLFNRVTTMEMINKILDKEPDKMHALMMLDVDNFKALNDTYGHMIGDDFLIELAGELKRSFRGSDVVGRIGGDEFFAFMRNVPDVDMVSRKANDLINVIQEVCNNYPDTNLSGSVGISIYPDHGKLLDELYGAADGALYQAKKKGKRQYIIAIKE